MSRNICKKSTSKYNSAKSHSAKPENTDDVLYKIAKNIGAKLITPDNIKSDNSNPVFTAIISTNKYITKKEKKILQDKIMMK